LNLTSALTGSLADAFATGLLLSIEDQQQHLLNFALWLTAMEC